MKSNKITMEELRNIVNEFYSYLDNRTLFNKYVYSSDYNIMIEWNDRLFKAFLHSDLSQSTELYKECFTRFHNEF